MVTNSLSGFPNTSGSSARSPPPVRPAPANQAADTVDGGDFDRGAVRLGGVEDDLARIADDFFDKQRQFLDRRPLAGADVDDVAAGIMAHHEQAGGRQVVDVEEFPHRRACAPYDDGEGVAHFGLVEAADERRHQVTGLKVEVVVRPIQVGRHDGDVVGAVLPVVGPAQLDAGDFGHGVGLVGGFERAGEQIFLAQRLRRMLGIDAGAAQEQQFPDAGPESCLDYICLDHQIVVDELGRPSAVSQDAPHLGGGQEYILGALGGEKGGRPARASRAPCCCAEEVIIALVLQPTGQCRADQAAGRRHISWRFCPLSQLHSGR